MSSFSASGLTNKGRALQAKAQAGVQLVYTKAVAGDGTLGNQSIGPFTNVISPKQTYGLTRFKANGNMASIGFDLTNQEVTTGFYFREIGIFANDPDEGEILYWYANAGNTADYIPPGGGSDIIEKTFDVLVFVGMATNVSAVINDSLIYATVEALEDALDAAKAYTDSKFSQIIIQDASLTQKGVVQLTNLTNSTSQSLAPTAKAVNDARQAAIGAAATDATTKANAAETNSKAYADANFRKPSEIVNANLVKNSSALLGFNYWTQRANIFFETFTNQTVGGFFGVNTAVPGGEYAILDNESIGVSPGASYLLQAVFHTSGSYANTTVHIEICNAVTNSIINSLGANPQAWWHRKTKVVTIPAGVNSVFVRLVVTNAPAIATKGIARIKFSEIMNSLNQDMPYSDELTTRALYEGVESAKQSGVDAKNGIVGAINAKGGSASTSDTWATLITKINALATKKPQVVTPAVSYTNASQTEFMGMGSRYYEVATFPAGTGFIESFNLGAAINSVSGNNIYIGSGNSFNDTEVRLVLIDKNNTEWTVCINENISGTVDFLSIYIDRGVAFFRNQNVNTHVVTMNMPGNFDRTGAYRLSFRQINKSSGWSHAYMSFINTPIYSF